MAMTYLTKLKPEPMGAHSLSTAYGVNSLVMSEDGATAYISVKDVPAGTPLTNTEYWKIHTDLTAVKQSADAAAQRANAARGEMLEIARNLTDAVEKSGNPVHAELVGGLPFDRVTTALSPIQAGSGDPSPSNIRPISGWTGAALTRCGINLADFAFVGNTLNNNGMSGTFDNNGLVISGTPAYDYAHILIADNIKLQKGAYFVSGGDVTKVYLQVGIIDASGNTTFYVNDKFTIKGNEQVVSFSIQAGLKSNTGTLSNYRLQPMIICGSSAPTAYEPYHGNTYTADFGQTVYGGTLDWQTGVLTADRAFYTFDGSEGLTSGGWNNPYSYVLWNFFPRIVNCGMSEVADAYCSHYIVRSVGYVITNAIAGFGIYDSGNLIFSSPTHADVDAFKSYLASQHAAGTPVQVCYKLATPQTIQLTPQEIKQMQRMNTLYGDGSISIIGRADKALALEARIAALEAAG